MERTQLHSFDGSSLCSTKNNQFKNRDQQDIKIPKKKVILIVEDDLTNHFYLEEVLSKSFEIMSAYNGKEAVEKVKMNRRIDLVIMDLRMPVMDGFEATAKIKLIRKNLPIVAHSAYALSREKNQAIKAGCNDYLTKPVMERELLKVIAKYLNQNTLN
ncbi:MAG: response regulator [Bacteroidales bacterium]|nr:response regulator [Bacteroidales bacterium]